MSPDVVLLQEIRAPRPLAHEPTRARDYGPAFEPPPGYTAASQPAEKPGYAGVAIWSRLGIEEVTYGIGLARADAEGRAVGAVICGVEFWSLYLPSGSSGPERQAWKMDVLAYVGPWLEARLSRSRHTGRPVVVGGDFNIAHTPMDIKNARANEKHSGFLPEERAWMSAVLASGWRDVFREVYPSKVAYSWWSNRGQAYAKDVGWRIDYLLATPGVDVGDVLHDRPARLADHAPVIASLTLAPRAP